MEGSKTISGENRTVKRVKTLNRDFLIFAFFLLLSFVFWYLNSLRKEIEVDIKYPVKYINVPRDRELDSKIISKVYLNLKGPGYSIVKLKLSGNRAPLVIDFSKVAWKRVPESKTPNYYITSSSLLTNFSRQLRSEFEIVSVKPDTIFFTLGRKTPVSTTKSSGGSGK